MYGEERELTNDHLTQQIVDAARRVSDLLGRDHIAAVYQHAVAQELRRRGLRVQTQVPVGVYADGVIVGRYWTDLLVGDTVLVEVRAVPGLDDTHVAQCDNDLRSTANPLCVLLNFGAPQLEIQQLARDA